MATETTPFRQREPRRPPRRPLDGTLVVDGKTHRVVVVDLNTGGLCVTTQAANPTAPAIGADGELSIKTTKLEKVGCRLCDVSRTKDNFPRFHLAFKKPQPVTDLADGHPMPSIWSDRVLSLPTMDLADVAALIHPDSELWARFDKPPRQWRGFFQSPVSKEAYTLDGSFQFDDRGAIKNDDVASEALAEWLGNREYPICRWLRDGIPDSRLFAAIEQQLADCALADADLYNQPVCRLVRASQLRFDPDYAAVYQLTPAQVRFTARQEEDEDPRHVLNRNQRLFRGASESFQSLIAMFDSDLGSAWRPEERTGDSRFVREADGVTQTKDFLRLSEPGRIQATTPKDLNFYSPLRYWSPPPSFARCVFHMLFWRAILTGRDLYGRPVPEWPSEDPSPEQLFDARVNDFLVVIDKFNAARYRIGTYATLFQLLGAVTWRVYKAFEDNLHRALEEIGTDLTLTPLELFTPDHIGRGTGNIVVDGTNLEMSIPFATNPSRHWELLHRGDQASTTVKDLLLFLRDRMLELILWSHYQMEVRSIGMIPIQRVYRIELKQRLKMLAQDAMEEYKASGQLLGEMKLALKDPDRMATQVRLVKIYDRSRSRNIDKNLLTWFHRSDSKRQRVEVAQGSIPFLQAEPAVEGAATAALPTQPLWEIRDDERSLYRGIEPLQSLRQMVWYYHRVRESVRHLSRDDKYAEERFFARVPPDPMREARRYISADLESYALEFFLQRRDWAACCRAALVGPGRESHLAEAQLNPSRHPCQMLRGFARLVDRKKGYAYQEFLGETLPMFVAIHTHLSSITKSLTDLYYCATELPLASFTDAGLSEIRHLTSEMRRIMRGLLVATHLQPQDEWQADLVSYLMSCRADCQRLFETIPRYYQTHRLRLVVFPIDEVSPDIDPHARGGAHPFPVACLPGSAGLYREFLEAYDNIARHVMAVTYWSVRLHSTWFFVPRRVLRAISPMFVT